ncbi:hypothetical protein ACNO8X_18330 [Mycobacterium sp. PDNC021]|uniref:hypothetical protein n=1 Tax=Mycobacterium sp. PDNC021 TaxID=3391399 RepID=UPI003AB046B8
MLRTLSDLPAPADAIECGDWDQDGHRSVTYFMEKVAGITVVVDCLQDFTGACAPREMWFHGPDLVEPADAELDAFIAALSAGRAIRDNRA